MNASGFDRGQLASLLAREQQTFVELHPRSHALAERAAASLLGGVPMNWMGRWPGPFPLFAREAHGATRAWGLEPDLFTNGKPIAGGIPAAAYGMTQAVADRAEPTVSEADESDLSGIEATSAVNAPADTFLHLFCLNRSILLTPFHNMALMGPATTDAMIDHHTEVFAAAVRELVSVGNDS